jgi:two-component system chemotaxis response regulator CheY
MMFLVVEDSRTTRNLIKNYISEIKLGSKCDFLDAEDGESALEILKTTPVDFVLLDWNLTTKITGLDILKVIRTVDTLKNLPVVMITGESDKLNVIEAIKHGANDFISKPIDKKLFFEKIQKAVSNVKQ